MKLVLFIALFISSHVASTQTKGVAQLNQYPPMEKVASDFRSLLQRPAVDFRHSFQSFITDTVLIEKGFIYTEETEKVPILIYKPVTRGLKIFPGCHLSSWYRRK